MTGDDIASAIWEGSFTLFGVEVGCAVLNDGRRLLDAAGVEKMFEAMARGVAINMGEWESFVAWQKGGRHPAQTSTPKGP